MGLTYGGQDAEVLAQRSVITSFYSQRTPKTKGKPKKQKHQQKKIHSQRKVWLKFDQFKGLGDDGNLAW